MSRFLEKHEERTVEERRFLQSKAEEKYRLTHDYNPIAGAYYDQSREQHFAQSREKLQALQGRAQQHRLPPSIRYGEGNDYNIINQQVRRKNEWYFFMFFISITAVKNVVMMLEM